MVSPSGNRGEVRTDVQCAVCGTPVAGPKVLWEYRGHGIILCRTCASLPMAVRLERLAPQLRRLRRENRRAEQAAVPPPPPVRSDIREDQVEELVLHAFIDLIYERKAAGRPYLAATMETIAAWLSERTTLRVRAQHVQALTLALRDGGIIGVGGSGIGTPNTYDTREQEMGTAAFWDQVDAFLLVYRLPGRRALLQVEP